MMNSIHKYKLTMALILSIVSGCNTIGPFSQKAYEQTTSLKVEALNTMDKAIEPYDTQTTSIESLKINMEKAYEYAKGQPKNEIVTKQWEIIKDPTRNSLGGFIKRWKEDNDGRGLNPLFIDQAKGLVSDGFDTIIELESGKRKPNETLSK